VERGRKSLGFTTDFKVTAMREKGKLIKQRNLKEIQ
jgi:hypothetical protein